MANDTPAGLRIGELSRRVGLSPDVLRAWERRYGLLRPRRSSSGQRLYSEDDELRVRSMRAHIERGFAPAVAARLAGQGAQEPVGAPPGEAPDRLRAELRAALDRLDDAGAQAVFDRLLTRFALDTVLRDVVLPFLAELGERWARRQASVAQEHFASALVHGRLRALARGADQGVGPRAVLACPSQERHELGLECFGLALQARGWRVTYLGADTPTGALAETAARLRPDLVVVAAAWREPLVRAADELAVVAAGHRVALGGRGADERLARRIGARLLPDDPIAAADLVTAGPAG